MTMNSEQVHEALIRSSGSTWRDPLDRPYLDQCDRLNILTSARDMVDKSVHLAQPLIFLPCQAESHGAAFVIPAESKLYPRGAYSGTPRDMHTMAANAYG